jgi:hypothetical protein
MTRDTFSKMSPAQRAFWLDSVSPTSSWSFGDDIFCMHCDGVFKAEDVGCDDEGDPTCPVCRNATPLDFHKMPWWREDLIAENAAGRRKWIGKSIKAESGKPRNLPAA